MSVSKIPSGRWRARYRDESGKQHAQHFDTKAAAERWVRNQLADIERGEWLDPRQAKVTFKEYAEKWRVIQAHRPSTASNVETYLRVHAYPTFGDRKMRSIRSSEIRAWMKQLEAGSEENKRKPLKPASVELAFRWLATVFKAAVADGVVRTSPCTGITPARPDRGKLRLLTVEQVAARAAKVPRRYRALVLFAAGSGLRPGECFGLTVDRIDFLRRTVTVDRQLVSTRAGKPTWGPPKSPAGHRTVPLAQGVCDALAAHLAEFRPGDNGLVFTNSARHPLTRSAWSTAWHGAESEEDAWSTPHDLRHFFASLLIHRGCTVKAVQVRLGHESALETLNTYGHLWPSGDDDVRDAVEDVLGPVLNQSSEVLKKIRKRRKAAGADSAENRRSAAVHSL